MDKYNFTNGMKVLFTGYSVDGAPSYYGANDENIPTETVLNLIVSIENEITYFIDTETNKRYTLKELTLYTDHFNFEILEVTK